jgi:aryl-alcohol dehydrogenase-like predicted oxidoreductase
MLYRVLGRTGIRVSEIGFGCGNVGGLMVRGSHEEQVEAVSRALELGIDYFDTAPSYGDRRSETNLGRVLEELSPEVTVYGDRRSETNLGRVLEELSPEVTVATKVRIGAEDLDDIQGAVERSLEASLKRLRRDSVDLLQLHSRVAMERDGEGWGGAIGLEDVLGEGGVADAFDSVRSKGLTRFVGFTGLGEAEALHRVVESGRLDVMQAYCNMINPTAGWDVPDDFSGYNFGRLIDKASAMGMGVAAIRVMAAGAIGGERARAGHASPLVRGPMVPGGEYGDDEAKAKSLDFMVSGDVSSLPEAAIRFVLMQPGVSVVLVGFSNLGQVEEAAEAPQGVLGTQSIAEPA